MNTTWTKPLFYLAALYDGLLGLAFVFFWRQVFAAMDVTPPNHPGYAQFPALLLIIFGAMFLQIATDPVRYRHLILYGIALKVAYCGTVFFHDLTTGIPSMWVWFAWADLAFLALFVIAYRSLSGSTIGTRAQPQPM